MENFLPKDYELPTKDNGYFRFEQGENKFRILSSAVVGYEYWTETEEGGRKPVRVKSIKELVGTPQQYDAKHFWAFIVFNYRTSSLQIMQITQMTIMRVIKSLTKDEDWGNPKEYDIVVTRAGEGMETEYTVTAKPHKEFEHKEVLKQLKTIDLEALFEGVNPFEANEPVVEKNEEVKVESIPF